MNRAAILRPFCFWLHIAFVAYAILGWVVPNATWLTVHMCFLPLMVLSWRLNNDSCVLNTIENWMLTGQWHDPSNVEEGQFVRVCLKRATGVDLRKAHVTAISYGLMALSWVGSAFHLWRLTRN